MTDAVAAYLSDLTGTGLEITSPGNGQINTADTFQAEIITAYIPAALEGPDKKGAAVKIAELRQFLAKAWHVFPGCPEPIIQTAIILEEDWGKKWKSFFTSFQITPTLTIKPSWEKTKKPRTWGKAPEIIIEMDPGLAFGTGHHASTQLALLLLEDLFKDSAPKLDKVLDVGTGSGILAMACGLFGAQEILALDNDPDAVETAKQNIIRNRLEDKITVSDQDVRSLKAVFDIVVANITHDILSDLAMLLASCINPKGYLVLSGILKGEQEHSIAEIFAGQGLAFRKSLTKDEWAALLFQKK